MFLFSKYFIKNKPQATRLSADERQYYKLKKINRDYLTTKNRLAIAEVRAKCSHCGADS